MFKFAAAATLAAAILLLPTQNALFPPTNVSGPEAAALEKQRVGINEALLPPAAKRGTIQLEFTVQPDGTVADIKDLHPAADANAVLNYLYNAAFDSLSKWTYDPYRVNSLPAPMRVRIQFKFDYPKAPTITYL
jgi:hypothetical protein